MRTLQYKFDRWVHLRSGRSYHMISQPPKSISIHFKPPTPENMIDDETGEQLIQLEEDLVETYKNKFQIYQIKEVLMCYKFEEYSSLIPGGMSEEEVNRAMLKIVYDTLIESIRAKYALSFTTPTSQNTTTKFSFHTIS